ncbi:tRNA (adenosine(37)-N6)-threonylcarbamoyltransferase complex ATPase subunit type 1 TsaE [Winogradskyella sp.]|uniref:tRNA (adenosine(37)-N6)-threonylcarbamoyltransferase complex ATPase subunit type 1 TsaE n=1 Tax=Winogradskyella sp. TaxID=1883156 RepID=UPI0025D02058|nr:tRNA (adenosine(37)-N6)-threonylcarbamoyltransferase complex ATPase subunit type 1 TsaE [Winogradskyella sp.]MCT4629168.1 tRNA (adenosine(37)-N6)-threonylcarbamoyltransferase complex ATPase subunit type 1 TsaE [Winogradskyella sp.]
MNTIELTYHLDEINTAALDVLKHLESKVILFNGNMGAGKTTLINALLKAMQSDDVATSPSFSIVNEYKIPNDRVFHFDFYRIESVEEALNFGIEDYFNSKHWLFIEWPDRVESLLPEHTQTLTITHIDNNKRSLKLTINNKLLTEHNAMTEPKF